MNRLSKEYCFCSSKKMSPLFCVPKTASALVRLASMHRILSSREPEKMSTLPEDAQLMPENEPENFRFKPEKFSFHVSSNTKHSENPKSHAISKFFSNRFKNLRPFQLFRFVPLCSAKNFSFILSVLSVSPVNSVSRLHASQQPAAPASPIAYRYRKNQKILSPIRLFDTFFATQNELSPDCLLELKHEIVTTNHAPEK